MGKLFFYLLHLSAFVPSALLLWVTIRSQGIVKPWFPSYICLCAILSARYRWGWFVPCVILGIFASPFLGPAIRGTPAAEIEAIAVGLFCGVHWGLLVGLFLELFIGNPFHSHRKSDNRIEDSSTTDHTEVYGSLMQDQSE